MWSRVLSGAEWAAEAEAASADIRKHVRSARAAGAEPGGGSALLDLTTLEGAQYCVRLSVDGYRVVGRRHGRTDGPPQPAYETPYALLGAISPQYRDSFGGELMTRLLELANKADAQ